MKIFCIIKKHLYNADVDAITLIDEYGHRFPISKQRLSGTHSDGSWWSGNYYGVNLPDNTFIGSDDVASLLNQIELMGYQIVNPFSVVISNW